MLPKTSKQKLGKEKLQPVHLISIIKSLPGEKIVTLAYNNNSSFKVDVHGDGTFGYDDSSDEIEALFLAKLHSAMSTSGGLVIRQFLDAGENITQSDGSTFTMPLKVLMMFCITNGQILPIPAEDAKFANETNYATGESIGAESHVIYVDSSELISKYFS